MEFASRILSILLGVAVVAFLLWPAKIPLGFGGVWWASQKAQSRPEPPPPKPEPQQQANPPAPPPQAAAQPPALPPQLEQHAVEPSAAPPKPAPAPQAKAEGEQTAALNENGKKETGTATPQTASKLYYRVTVRDAGTLQSGGVVIKLAGIATRGADATCKNAKGKNWACGAQAKAALARLIRGRAVTCQVPQEPEHEDIVARCSLSGDDRSTWMVRQGWAEPAFSPVVGFLLVDLIGVTFGRSAESSASCVPSSLPILLAHLGRVFTGLFRLPRGRPLIVGGNDHRAWRQGRVCLGRHVRARRHAESAITAALTTNALTWVIFVSFSGERTNCAAGKFLAKKIGADRNFPARAYEMLNCSATIRVARHPRCLPRAA